MGVFIGVGALKSQVNTLIAQMTVALENITSQDGRITANEGSISTLETNMALALSTLEGEVDSRLDTIEGKLGDGLFTDVIHNQAESSDLVFFFLDANNGEIERNKYVSTTGTTVWLDAGSTGVITASGYDEKKRFTIRGTMQGTEQVKVVLVGHQSGTGSTGYLRVRLNGSTVQGGMSLPDTNHGGPTTTHTVTVTLDAGDTNNIQIDVSGNGDGVTLTSATIQGTTSVERMGATWSNQ